MAVRHSISWWCFQAHFMPTELIATAVDLGFDGFDLVDREHWQAISDAGLQIAAIVGHSSLRDGLNKEANHDRIEAEIVANLELATKFSIPNLICFSGDRHSDSDERGMEVTASGLRRVASAAEDAGVQLIVELLNSKVDHPGYQCDHTAWGVELVRGVDSPNVKLLYDIYHMQIMEGDIIRTIDEYHSWFGHYHTAGNPGRGNIDATQEICYPPIVRAIARTGFDGFIGHEFKPAGDPRATLRQALEICGRG